MDHRDVTNLQRAGQGLPDLRREPGVLERFEGVQGEEPDGVALKQMVR